MRQETWETDSVVSDTVMQGIPRGLSSGAMYPKIKNVCAEFLMEDGNDDLKKMGWPHNDLRRPAPFPRSALLLLGFYGFPGCTAR